MVVRIEALRTPCPSSGDRTGRWRSKSSRSVPPFRHPVIERPDDRPDPAAYWLVPSPGDRTDDEGRHHPHYVVPRDARPPVISSSRTRTHAAPYSSPWYENDSQASAMNAVASGPASAAVPTIRGAANRNS